MFITSRALTRLLGKQRGLLRHPDGHEVVRRMLGHRDIRTTITFYAGMETTAAAKAYAAILDDLQPRRGRGRGRVSRALARRRS